MKYLSEALKINNTLTKLYLFYNNIGDEGDIYLDIINDKLEQNKLYQQKIQNEMEDLKLIPMYLNKSEIYISNEAQQEYNNFLNKMRYYKTNEDQLIEDRINEK